MFDAIKSIIGDIASGAVKDQRISLSHEQCATLDFKLREALSEVSTLRDKIVALLAENTALLKRTVELDNLVADRDAKIDKLTASEQKNRTGDRPDDEQKILQFISETDGPTTTQISQCFKIGEQVCRLHLHELSGAELIYSSDHMNRQSTYRLTNEGRKYLMIRGLLK